ncbi:hypothetical protein EVAR_31059_1 [Eumeta japonica]|uniref:Uncharacterized protein n=1 Tax=Eumeta variegata TaxID=151549 RepID=A0A4C1VDX4_EUMVA|nr:hypothetical protein EVAR_31059_1 [Eumeta japonica]
MESQLNLTVGLNCRRVDAPRCPTFALRADPSWSPVQLLFYYFYAILLFTAQIANELTNDSLTPCSTEDVKSSNPGVINKFQPAMRRRGGFSSEILKLD